MRSHQNLSLMFKPQISEKSQEIAANYKQMQSNDIIERLLSK